MVIPCERLEHHEKAQMTGLLLQKNTTGGDEWFGAFGTRKNITSKKKKFELDSAVRCDVPVQRADGYLLSYS